MLQKIDSNLHATRLPIPPLKFRGSTMSTGHMGRRFEQPCSVELRHPGRTIEPCAGKEGRMSGCAATDTPGARPSRDIRWNQLADACLVGKAGFAAA